VEPLLRKEVFMVPRREQGFTLVELMIVVVIIGILAAIAIPQFLKFQLRSKTSEANQIIGGIHSVQEGFSSKWAYYGEFGPQPPGAIPTGPKNAWQSCPDNTLGHCNLGYQPQGRTYFQYAVAADPGGTAFFTTGQTPVFPVPSAQFQMGVDTQNYPCAGGTGCSGAQGSVLASSGTVDITIGAQGDLNNNGSVCIYVATDENKDVKPTTDPYVCGEDEF
jgi:type IV pilus assembly protein PilA